MQGDQGGGTKYFEDALRVFEEEYSLWDTAWVLIALGANASGAGKFEEATMASLRSISLFNELGDVRWLVEAYSMAGMTFATNFGFCEEGLLMLEKAEELSENAKLGDYLRLAQINAESAWAYSSLRDPKNALVKDLKALKYAERTDSFWGKGMAYANLTIDYSVLGEVSNAEEYFDRLMKLPPESLENRMVNAQLAKAMLLAGKKQWEPSIQIFDGILASLKEKPNPGIEAIVKSCYGWALFKRKHLLKALAQIREAKKIYKDMAERFAHVNLQPNMMTPAKVLTDQIFEARLDLVNVSRSNGKLIRIENLSHPDLSIESTSQEFIIQNGAIDFREKALEPLSVTSLKLNLKAKKASIFNINPRIVYKDDSGKIKTTQIKSLKIQAVSNNTEHKIESTPEIIMNKFEFKYESAQTGTTPKGVVLYLPGTYGSGEMITSNPVTDNWTLTENESEGIYLANRGYDVYAMDYRTHFVPDSLNPLPPNSIDSSQLSFMANWGWDQWISDINEAVNKVKTVSGAPSVFMIGASFGGRATMNYATIYPQNLRGIILLDGGNASANTAPTNQYNLTAALLQDNASKTWYSTNPNLPGGTPLSPSFKYVAQYATENPGAPPINPYTNTPLNPPANPVTGKPFANITDWFTFIFQYVGMTNVTGGKMNPTTLVWFFASMDMFWPNRLNLEFNAYNGWTNCPYSAPKISAPLQLWKEETGVRTRLLH
jgi:tetratricopeptide (TPR) repeat protein/pimeloyl-ACP methyl ester carboxylesterase